MFVGHYTHKKACRNTYRQAWYHVRSWILWNQLWWNIWGL